MNKFLFIAFTLIVATVNAQDAFLRRDLIVNFGAGLISYEKVTYNRAEPALKSLPLFVSAEYGFTPSISAGVFAGYYSREFRYLDSISGEMRGSRMFKSRYIPFGIKGTIHFTKWLEKRYKTDLLSENLDLYFSVLLGYRYNFIQLADGLNYKSKSQPVAGAVLGARYYFHYRFAAFIEVGPGIFGIGNLGLTLRF